MSLKHQNIEDIYPLSPMQQGMLFHSLYEPTSQVYVTQLSCDVLGALNAPAFAQAWQRVSDRHSVLRTAFVWEKLEKPLQIVGRQLPISWEIQDWRTVSPPDYQAQLELFREADRKRGFELSKAPLMRLTLIQFTETHYHLLWTHHHLLLDGWSVPIIFTEVLAEYEGICQDQPADLTPPHPYRNYIAWLQQQDDSKVAAFWQTKLKGFTAPTPLGIDRVKLSSQEEIYVEQEIKLSLPETAALKAFAQQHHLTLSTLIQGAWALILSHYSAQTDIVFGTTVSGRSSTLPNVESMVGLFINTLPMRVSVVADELLLPWLAQIQSQQIEARQYEYSSLVEIQGWSEVPRDLPLFESLVIFENYPVESSLTEKLSQLKIANIRTFEQTNYPLSLYAIPAAELTVKISYNCHRFEASAITRLLGHLQTLLAGIVKNPHQRLAEFPLLTEPERHQLLVEWNQTQVEEYLTQGFPQLFEAQAERTPDAIAVIFEEQFLTYQQLNTKANQLAHYLQTMGVKPDSLVGLCVTRSLELIVGCLGILKAGAAYLPLDPAYPADRLAFMLADSEASVLLTQTSLLTMLPQHSAKVVCLDTDWAEIAKQPQTNLTTQITPESLAYTIYTSGSTGRPKGVQIPHKALANFLRAMQQTPGLTERDILLSVTTLSFDIAALELYLPLIAGARLVLASREVALDGTQLMQRLKTAGATVMQATPATWRLLLAAGWSGGQPLKILCGGEALDPVLADRLLSCGTEVWNLYGPTETTIWSSVYRVESQQDLRRQVAIGRPIANTQFYVLNSQQQLVPIGVPGQLWIGGAGVARGYLKRPELTAKKFITNSFNSESFASEILYQTGDLVRYRPDGNLEYLGRLDRQVKIRGFRIELGEIEALLSQHPSVQEAVVVVRESESETQQLIAYLVLHSEAVFTDTELRHFLAKTLPPYMIPSLLIRLESLPLTPNGKVDRRALPAPDMLRPQLDVTYVLPKTEIERRVAQIWQKILKIEQVGIHDIFFDLGGHSLLVMLVYSQLREQFQTSLSMLDLFRYPTISSLVEQLSQRNQDSREIEIKTTQLQVGKNQQRTRLQKLQTLGKTQGGYQG